MKTEGLLGLNRREHQEDGYWIGTNKGKDRERDQAAPKPDDTVNFTDEQKSKENSNLK